MEMSGMKKKVVCMVVVALMCVVLLATVSAATVDFGKSNQLFTQKGIVSQVTPVYLGNTDTVKAVPFYLHPKFSPIIRQWAYTPYIRMPVSYSPITPVPTPVSSTSSLGGLIIRGGDAGGEWISLRSNFYNPSMPIYDGKWHIDVGTTPAYWENMILPGSYTIKISTGMGLVGVYYCQTVTVVAGQTTVVQANGACPFCNVTCSS